MKKLVALCLLLSGLVLTGCSGKSNYDTIRIAEVTRSLFYAPLYVAVNEGIFQRHGIEVDIILTPGADRVMAALISGDVQVGLMGPEASVYVYNQGRADYAINFAQLTQKDGSFLVGRNADPNWNFSNLTDAEIIGGRRGGMPLMTLEYVLRNQGVDFRRDDSNARVNVRTDIDFAAMAGAFTRGIGDYVALFEPVATRMENEGIGHIVASIGDYAGYLPYTAFSTTKSFLDNNEDLLIRFTKALYEAQTWVYAHSDEEVAQSLASWFRDTSLNDIVRVIARYRNIEAWALTPIMTEEGLDKLLDIMKLAGEITTRVPFTTIVNTRIAEIAMGR